MELQILPGERMHWLENKEKFGSREERQKLGKFVLRCCKSQFPVTVWVEKLDMKQTFYVAPVMIEGEAKKVVLYYKHFFLCMKVEDAATWVKTLMFSNLHFYYFCNLNFYYSNCSNSNSEYSIVTYNHL